MWDGGWPLGLLGGIMSLQGQLSVRLHPNKLTVTLKDFKE